MHAEKIAQAVADSVYLGSLDRLLAVAIHTFVSALETLLKFLVVKVTGGHRIATNIQNVPRPLRGEKDFAIAWP